ncbi:hypothetical protein B0H63DRAFT_181546 [Podospora didyma]|uniref:Zn(2)-C6 fungal-type domain-containing protein n=1 Tax=Podospora didyma TaxID=330526 RepID=A0AAE0TZM1_9PEZI|nr:hypothetical protein B0H63DRAFT_181546 [Podospora didyma]
MVRPRRSKVKTGCQTCKTRKVKCDEGRPACVRCVSTGRACDGYGIWGGGSKHSDGPQRNVRPNLNSTTQLVIATVTPQTQTEHA